MAVGKSGYIDVTVQPSSVGTIRVYWREDYDVVDNYSTITITDIQGYLWHRSGWANLSFEVLVDGVMVASSPREWMFSAQTDTTLRSVVRTSNSNAGFTPITSGRIYHNEDGTKTTSITFNLVECFISSVGFQGSRSTASSAIALTSIPRASVLSADNGTLGVAQTLTVDRKASGYTHSIDWVCGSASGTICTKSSALSFNWTPSIDLASQNTTGASVSAVFTITTYSGDTAIGSKTLNVIYAIPDSVKPSVTMTITDANGYADKYGGYVQKRSKLKVVLGVVTAYGSEISVNAVSVEGVTYYGETIETAIINGSGAVAVTATVTDKRGRVGTATVNVDVLEYASPAILGVTYNRANADGTDNPVGEHAEVTMNASVTALGNKNSATYRLQYKKLSDSAYTDFDMSGYQNVYSLEDAVAIFSASADYSYNIVFTVSDDFSEKFGVAKTEFVLQTGKVLMHRRAKGNGMGLGRICEEDDLLDIDWNTKVRKRLSVGDNVQIWTDGEGGNVEIKSGNGHTNSWQIDAHDGNLRFYTWRESDATYREVKFEQETGLIGRESLLNAYPVGAIYISSNPTSPAALFGGTWERLANTFLWGTDVDANIGKTGGESAHTLTVNEMPSHTHTATAYARSSGSYSASVAKLMYQDNTTTAWVAENMTWINDTGGGAAHNNMPPYLEVAMWKRVG